jgi:hypothetical protein
MEAPPVCYFLRLSMMVTARRRVVFLLNLKMRKGLASSLGFLRPT